MNITNETNNDGDSIIEYFGSDLLDALMELEQDYGKLLIVEGLQLLAKCDSENEEFCMEFRAEEAWLALELEEVLANYRKRCSKERKLMGAIEV